jgi:glycosyltransferase involved in cell wall biosynthesis
MFPRLLMISSYPYDKCGISTYTKNLLQNFTNKNNISTYTIKLTQDKPFKYSLKSLKLFKLLLVKKYDVCHFQYTPTILGPLFPLFLLFARIKGAKTITTVHENMEIYVKYRPKFIQWTGYKYEAAVIRLSNKLFVMSERQKKELSNNHRNIDEQKFVVVPQGIEAFEPKINNTKNKKIIIGFFGFIKKGKGLETLAKSFLQVANFLPDNSEFLIAGHAIDKSYLSQIKKLYNPISKQVVWRGYLPDKKMKQLMNECTCVVLPYDKSTNSAILSDAISAEVPVVVTSVGSLQEIVEEWDIGIVCPPKKSTTLAQAIEKIINNNEYRKELVSNVKSLKSAYSWKFVVSEHMKAYSKA